MKTIRKICRKLELLSIKMVNISVNGMLDDVYLKWIFRSLYECRMKPKTIEFCIVRVEDYTGKSGFIEILAPWNILRGAFSDHDRFGQRL